MPEEILLKQLVTRVYQNSRKAESMLRNIIMFQVIQYLKDKTGLGWREEGVRERCLTAL